MNKVPFVVWGNGVHCGNQLAQPSSHRDIFPTLFRLLSIDIGFPEFGRDLFKDLPIQNEFSKLGGNPRSLNFMGYVQNSRGVWRLGDPATFVCLEAAKIHNNCAFDPKEDAIERANLGMLDWSIRKSLTKH